MYTGEPDIACSTEALNCSIYNVEDSKHNDIDRRIVAKLAGRYVVIAKVAST